MTDTKSEPEIKIQLTKNFQGINFSLPKLKKLIKTVCGCFGKNDTSDSHIKTNKFEIGIVIVDDAEFQKINYKFLKRKSISDCLSFDLTDDNEPDSQRTFELVINGQMALRQAHLRGHSNEAELALYITHALLHNFGFDDLKPAMAKKMHTTEDEILQQLGYGLVYNNRSDTPERRKKK